jgi:hypothetical protein
MTNRQLFFVSRARHARTPFVPFLPEIIEDPFDVWLAFERHRGDGKVVLRLEPLKRLALTVSNHTLVAQAVGGRFEAWTVVPSTRLRQLERWR